MLPKKAPAQGQGMGQLFGQGMGQLLDGCAGQTELETQAPASAVAVLT